MFERRRNHAGMTVTAERVNDNVRVWHDTPRGRQLEQPPIPPPPPPLVLRETASAYTVAPTLTITGGHASTRRESRPFPLAEIAHQRVTGWLQIGNVLFCGWVVGVLAVCPPSLHTAPCIAVFGGVLGYLGTLLAFALLTVTQARSVLFGGGRPTWGAYVGYAAMFGVYGAIAVAQWDHNFVMAAEVLAGAALMQLVAIWQTSDPVKRP